jgi:hypothetical protein
MSNPVRKHTNTYSQKGIKSTCDLGASGIMDVVENIDQKVKQRFVGQFTHFLSKFRLVIALGIKIGFI